jgi:hypothetical protein
VDQPLERAYVSLRAQNPVATLLPDFSDGSDRAQDRARIVDALLMTQHAPALIGSFWTLYDSRRFVVMESEYEASHNVNHRHHCVC